MRKKRFRLIPVLLINHEGGLVKGREFKKHKYVGDPINTVKLFNDLEVDELVVLDIDATTKSSSIQYELLEEIASEAFMPMAYGGGLQKIEDVSRVLKMGFEKVIFNTAIYNNSSLIQETSKRYGASSTIASLDLGKKSFSKDLVLMSEAGSKKEKNKLDHYLNEIESMGVGELIVTYIPNEGKRQGLNIDILEKIVDRVNIPVIANGGLNSVDNAKQAIIKGASAVAGGAFFIFQGPHDAVLVSYPNELNYL